MITHRVGSHQEGDSYRYYNLTNYCDDSTVYPTAYQSISDPHDETQITCAFSAFPLCENIAVDWDSPAKEAVCWSCLDNTFWDSTAKKCVFTCPPERPITIIRNERGTVKDILSDKVNVSFYNEYECVADCPDFWLLLSYDGLLRCEPFIEAPDIFTDSFKLTLGACVNVDYIGNCLECD